eukprot:g22092.t1
MAPLDWDKAGEVVDPADFEDEEDSTAREVLDMAFSKMDPKKKQGYVEQLQKVQLAPEKRGPPIPQAREEELLAKGSKATQEEIEELLDLRRQRWGNAAGGRKGTGSCRACGTAAAQPFQCGTCKILDESRFMRQFLESIQTFDFQEMLADEPMDFSVTRLPFFLRPELPGINKTLGDTKDERTHQKGNIPRSLVERIKRRMPEWASAGKPQRLV